MIEYDVTSRRQLADDRAERLADDYRRAQRVPASRVRAGIRRRIASAAQVARRRPVAQDPAYRH